MATPTHTEALNEFWGLTRSWKTQQSNCMAYAHFCVEQANAKVPCVSDGMPHFPLVKFIAAHGLDDYAEALDMVFKAYHDNDYFDINAPLVIPGNAPHHFRPMNGKLPLEAAVRNGNIHAAEMLIRHGAATDIELDGLNLLAFVDEKFGHLYAIPPSAPRRVEARIRLTKVLLERDINASSSSTDCTADSLQPGPARRRLRNV